MTSLGAHQQAVLDVIVQAGHPVSAGEIAEAIGAHRNSVRNLLKKREDKGLLVIAHTAASAHTGRPTAYWTVAPESSAWKPRPDAAASWLFGARDAA